MKLSLHVNGTFFDLDASPGDSLLKVLRAQGNFGVKHGCETGECGACTILLDGKPVNSCVFLAAQAEGHQVETIEPVGRHPEQGWKLTAGLHPLQTAFVENGAIQCGFCTPAMILAARELLDRLPDPSEEQVREALSGVLCRCTGYLKPVQAILLAAAVMRGEAAGTLDDTIPAPVEWLPGESSPHAPGAAGSLGPAPFPISPSEDVLASTRVMPRIQVTPETETWQSVGKPEIKVDAVKLVQGKPAFAADIEMRGMLVAKVLHSPVAHANIKHIDASQALELPGVAAVLTWKDLPRVVYSTAGQSDPIPGPLDTFSLDKKVRFVGDRVAFVAAESEEIANQALGLIQVEYEPLPPIFDPAEALQPGVPRLHDEPEYVNFAESDPDRNLAAEIKIDIGDVEQGFAEADYIFENEYEVPKVQQAHIEPHVTVTYWDEDDRLVI
ncbi:MAG TPA: 2Fe-2S iron-sulfur cluster-binding protein, partial [Anaerolineales bacterium]